MNLDERQNKFISLMEHGVAAAFSEGFSKPFLVSVPHFPSCVKRKNEAKSSFTDSDVAAFMARRFVGFDHVYGKQHGCKQCQAKCLYRDASNYALGDVENQRIFAGYLFGVLEYTQNLTAQYSFLKENVLSDTKGFLESEDDANNFMFCFLISAGERFLKDKGVQYKLTPERITPLISTYNELISSFFSIPLKSQVSVDTENRLKEFQDIYTSTFLTGNGPFPGCNEFCDRVCLFRFDVAPFLSDKFIDEELAKVLSGGHSAKANVRRLCVAQAQKITLGNSKGFIENVALCFFIQKCVQRSVKQVLKNIEKWFM
jgi:hypothetical protein